MVFICPESLERSDESEVAEEEERPGLKLTPVAFARQQMTKFLSALLLPLFMFTPRRQPGSGKRTWMMVFVGLALLAYLISTVSLSAGAEFVQLIEVLFRASSLPSIFMPNTYSNGPQQR